MIIIKTTISNIIPAPMHPIISGISTTSEYAEALAAMVVFGVIVEEPKVVDGGREVFVDVCVVAIDSIDVVVNIVVVILVVVGCGISADVVDVVGA